MKHLGGEEHCTIAPPLVDLSVCHESGIAFCTHGACPLLPKDRFFTSNHELIQHERAHHPTTPPHAPTRNPSDLPATSPSTSTSTPQELPCAPGPSASPNVDLCHALFSPTNEDPAQPSLWADALHFLASPNNAPPGFRTNWFQYVKRRHKHEFSNVFYHIIQAIIISSARPDNDDADWRSSTSGFYWLLVHFEQLILAPTKKTDRDGESIQQTIRRRLIWFRQGRIRDLHAESARVSSWVDDGDRPARDGRRDAQEAANNDNYKSARDRACNPPTVARVGDNNLASVTALYSEPHPALNLDPPSLADHQPYHLPGNIAKSIRQSSRSKGKGCYTDSLDIFIDLAQQDDSAVDSTLQHLFDLVYRGLVPASARRYFRDSYLFCLYKDPSDPTKLRPIGVPTALRRIIASHVAKVYKDSFAAHLLPFNFAVGVERGMSFATTVAQLSIEKYIQTPQSRNELPSRSMVFLDLRNMFNLVSREKLRHVVATKFPELVPLVDLFYEDAANINLRWDDGSWRAISMLEGLNQGCPLSSIFAALVLNEVLVPLDQLMTARAEARVARGDYGDDNHGSKTVQEGYVDDLFASLAHEDVLFYIDKFNELARPLGLFINPYKTRILTSCNGQSIIPDLAAHDLEVASSLKSALELYSQEKPEIPGNDPIPVELTEGFIYLGSPVGSPSFANRYFRERVAAVQSEATLLAANIPDLQSRLRIFHQCTINKLPFLLGMEVLHNLPLDDQQFDPADWVDWVGPLTAGIDDQLRRFLGTLLGIPAETVPDHALQICRISLRDGGLGMIDPGTRAIIDFVTSMSKAAHSATQGFRVGSGDRSIRPPPAVAALFDPTANPDSAILRRYSRLCPHVALGACPDSVPPDAREDHFRHHTSPKSALGRLKSYCSKIRLKLLYETAPPDQLQHLPGLLNPSSSYPLIAMSRYIVANRLRNNLFRLALLRKLLIPIPEFTANPKCRCGARFDAYGHHAFSCIKNSKSCSHNMIRDKSNEFLRPVLIQAQYMFPGEEMEIEKQGLCPSNCKVKPFDASFPPRHPTCPYDDVGLDYTLIAPSPPLLTHPTNDVSQLSANAESHHQRGERKKFRRGGDKVDEADLSGPDPPTSRDIGEVHIRELNTANRILLPVSIGPYGDYGPIFRTFLFGQGPLRTMAALRDRPQANLALKRATNHPAPIGVVTTASIAWKTNKSRTFFGHSYTAPTPREAFLQQYGLHTTKALAVLLQKSFRNIVREPVNRGTADPPPSPADPPPSQFTFPDAPMTG